MKAETPKTPLPKYPASQRVIAEWISENRELFHDDGDFYVAGLARRFRLPEATIRRLLARVEEQADVDNEAVRANATLRRAVELQDMTSELLSRATQSMVDGGDMDLESLQKLVSMNSQMINSAARLRSVAPGRATKAAEAITVSIRGDDTAESSSAVSAFLGRIAAIDKGMEL